MPTMQSYASPAAFLEAQSGWRHPVVEQLRAAILAAAPFDETIKWGNLVYLANGPCILIHVEDHRILLGFWRGKRLRDTEPRIKASGKYELGNWTFREGDALETGQVTRLAAAAASLNADLGDPTAITK